MNKFILATAAVLLYAVPAANAQTCAPTPNCATLGYTDTPGTCTGKSLACPFDTSKVLCVNGAPQVGDLKYSLYSSNHNGWLKCDGTQYLQSAYLKLYNTITVSFCHKYTSRTDTAYSTNNCKSGYFAVPDYRGFFLRGLGMPNSTSNTVGAPSSNYGYSLLYKGGTINTSLYIPQYEQLPNITGQLGPMDDTAYIYNGAFHTAYGTSYDLENGGDFPSYVAGFDASKSNAIYGGTHVVPANYGTYIFIYAGE